MRRGFGGSAVGDAPRVGSHEILRERETNIKSEALDEIHVASDHQNWLHELFECGNSVISSRLNVRLEIIVGLGLKGYWIVAVFGTGDRLGFEESVKSFDEGHLVLI